VWEECGRLGNSVAIHIATPKLSSSNHAENERYEEIKRAAIGGFYGHRSFFSFKELLVRRVQILRPVPAVSTMNVVSWMFGIMRSRATSNSLKWERWPIKSSNRMLV